VARLRRKSSGCIGEGEGDGDGDADGDGEGEGMVPREGEEAIMTEGEETMTALAEDRRFGAETNAGFGEPLLGPPRRAEGMPGREGIGEMIPEFPEKEGALPAE
jgi:hypothetical protein